MAKKATKTAAKKAAKKAPAKKAPAKKVAAKKAPAKKAPAKKVAAKKAPAKKVAAKKAPAKKAPAKKAVKKVVETSIIARVDVGFGNSLYIRGEGAGLSWEKGVLLENISPYEWAFKTTKAATPVEFKFLINDELWAEGENLTVPAGGTSISSPAFNW
ncbi:MAG: hypothetical protein ACPGKS_03770 [Coraliomargarita sp.]